MTGAVVWITGRPASGKSTLAESLAADLRSKGHCACILDGDAVRAVLRPAPGYDDAARIDFYATLAGLAGVVAGQDMVAIVPATAHRAAFRRRAREMANRYLEVFVRAGREVCEERDIKGLYAAARRGELASLPGVGVEYEEPREADVVADGGHDVRAVADIVALLESDNRRTP